MKEVSTQTKDAFLQAYDENADGLFRYFTYRISDREIAKDLTQETFVKTWDFIQKGGEVKNLRAFLYTVASRLTIDEYRGRKPQDSLEEFQESTGFEPSVDSVSGMMDQMDGTKALELLKEVPEPYRSAVYMRYVEELSLSEIAEITNESHNTIAVHVHRGIEKLKSLWK